MEESGGIHRRRPLVDRDWTRGNVFRNLLMLSWPMFVGNMVMVLGFTVDLIWVGKLGSVSIAGVGIGGIAMMLVMSAMMGLTMGMRAIIARLIGAGDVSGANHAARQGFVISGVFAIAVALIGAFLSESIIGLFDLEADVIAVGTAYMRILFLGSAAMTFRGTADSIMQASGDAMNPMRIGIVVRLVHLALGPSLIFGWWLFPQMGVSGAAVANIVSESVGVGAGLWVLFTGRSRLRLTLEGFRLDPGMIWRIIRIGLPALISGIQRTASQFVLMLFMAPFGTMPVAAHAMVHKTEGLLFMPSMALGISSGVLMGQNLGARQPERAAKSAWLAVGLVEGILITISVMMLFGAEGVVRIFNTEPELVALASTFIRIACAGYAVMGFMASLMNALSGAGDTVPPMVISLIMSWGITIPLAHFLPQATDLGVYGIRWAMVAGMASGAVAFLMYFRTGRWKRKSV